ncbi:hypothetical protein [Thermocatellispora tengchongensis]|uniref:hypothetical protein n=1 Tax=Thermocatellispora tengchongensis TaxID=1073253 RepID=UPI00362C002D
MDTQSSSAPTTCTILTPSRPSSRFAYAAPTPISIEPYTFAVSAHCRSWARLSPNWRRVGSSAGRSRDTQAWNWATGDTSSHVDGSPLLAHDPVAQ